MQALTFCDGKFMSTRTAAGQFKGQFKGAMEDMSIGKGTRLAYISRFVRIHVGVGQRGRANDVESSAL